MKKYLRIDEVALHLGTSKRTIYRLIEEGELIGFKVRGSLRVPFSEIERYTKKQIRIYQEENGISFCDNCATCDNECQASLEGEK